MATLILADYLASQIKPKTPHQVEADWWSSLTRKEQAEYVKTHPDSKYAREKMNPRSPKGTPGVWPYPQPGAGKPKPNRKINL